ncbi:PQQ-binding-like beta-propeller repeat protein [Halomonas maura]|uniref:outer membrane protein assembly factor BamB family protein n=1 Tax=Halomonas maura TaxID=117606 RepID=UPI0025B51DF1|nr:PQQ-binding-like beta-propeller repeat protein [Halomonas maura]MDN3556260.1 PQQ-binding-like beta-propeller repeat protein [Halomonas maura]
MVRRKLLLLLLMAWLVLPGVSAADAAADGAPLVEAPVAGAVYPANPLVTERALFASDDGVVRLDRESGERVWRALAGEQTFAPVMAAGNLLVGTGSGLVALDPRSGEVRWRRFPEASLYSPSVAGDLAFVAGRDGTLRAVEAASGEVRWMRRFEGWVYPPALAAGVLVTGGQGARLTALEPATGRLLWQRPVGQELVYRPVAGRELVFVTTFAGEVLAFEPSSGDLRWRYRDRVASGSPTVDDRRLYLARLDGVLRVLDQASGTPLARHDLGAGVSMPLRVAAGRVVVADAASRVTVLRADDLSRVWQSTLDDALRAAPRLERDRLMLVTGADYRVRCLSLVSASSHDDARPDGP